jgi:hypothetical protein
MIIRIAMKNKVHILLIVIVCIFSTCKKDSSDDPPETSAPNFLLTGWLWPIASNTVRTYDFTQQQAAGSRTVEIRAWQLIGTLGWQSNQTFTALFEANENQVFITSATGYQEVWNIIDVQGSRMLIEVNGEQVAIFNCSEPGWPGLIRASTKACR